MKRQIGLFIICMGVLLAQAQTTSTIRRLEKQRSELHKQISESESLLLSTKKDVKSQLDNLALLTGQISERQKYIWQIENDVRTIQLEINRLTIELKQLEKDFAGQDPFNENMRRNLTIFREHAGRWRKGTPLARAAVQSQLLERRFQ